MSHKAVTWAFAQEVSKASAKFILVALAQCVNAESDDMVVWPSARHLAEMTGQDVKTVESALKRLRESGHIVDTGDRRGATGQVIVYRLCTPKNGGVQAQAKTPEFPDNTTENGCVIEQAKTPVFPIKDPQISAKDPQISHETPPKTGDGKGNGKGKEQGRKREERADALHIPGVPAQLLEDWIEVRKAKKAGKLTETAISMLTREAGKAGLTVAEAVEYCCGAGWQGFNAGWYANRTNNRPATASAQRTTGHTGLSTKNYSAGVNADGTFA